MLPKVLMVGILVLAACASEGGVPQTENGTSTSQSTQPGGVVGDAAIQLTMAGSQPMDLFRAQDIARLRIARTLYVHRCMAENGFPQLVEGTFVPLTSGLFAGLRVRPGMFGPESEEEARTWGYLLPRDRPGEAEPPVVISFDAAYDSRWDACFAEAIEALDTPLVAWERYWAIGSELEYRFHNSFENSEPREVFSAWLECMAGAGYVAGDVDAYMAQMYPPTFFGVVTGTWIGVTPPETPKAIPGTVEVLAVGDPGTYIPDEDEVQLALADVACKESTGFWQALVPPLLEAQADIMEDFEAELIELNEQLDEAFRRASEMVP